MPRILIIDDTPENLMILAEALQADYKVSAANGGDAALKLIDKGLKFDLILSDVMMPEISGYDLFEKLQKRADTKNIPVIFLTALSDNDEEFKGLSMGAVDYITKPVNIPLLKARLKNHLALKLLRDNLEEEVRSRTEQIAYSQEVLIEGLGTLAEFRDPETGEHIRRTQLYVREIADYMKMNNPKYASLTDREISSMYRAAPMHDIGKVGISDTILLKEGPLTKDEFETMKYHTQFGYSALKKIQDKDPESELIKMGMEITLSHHEKWDGTGYPNGLQGDEIPVGQNYDSIRHIRRTEKCQTL